MVSMFVAPTGYGDYDDGWGYNDNNWGGPRGGRGFAMKPGGGNNGGRGGGGGGGGGGMWQNDGGHCVHMRGLPFRATESDIAEVEPSLSPPARFTPISAGTNINICSFSLHSFSGHLTQSASG